jgi:hypothetical protein
LLHKISTFLPNRKVFGLAAQNLNFSAEPQSFWACCTKSQLFCRTAKFLDFCARLRAKNLFLRQKTVTTQVFLLATKLFEPFLL